MIKSKGGYRIIDLGRVSLSATPVTYEDIYNKFVSELGKPILLCGINIGGIEVQDAYVQPVLTESGFQMTLGDHTITVASNGAVTATEGIVGTDSGDYHGIPAGGTTGQVLSKTTDNDYDAGWTNPQSGGSEIDITSITIDLISTPALPTTAGTPTDMKAYLPISDNDALKNLVVGSQCIVKLLEIVSANTGYEFALTTFASNVVNITEYSDTRNNVEFPPLVMIDKNGKLYTVQLSLRYYKADGKIIPASSTFMVTLLA